MDRKVLDSLANIDDAAEKVLNQADGKKEELTKAMDEKIAAFDEESDRTSREEIERLKEELEGRQKKALEDLQTSTDAELSRLDRDFLNKKEEIADGIVRQILQ
ncbi:MAG: hypothetical protein VZR02_02085 [Lachnospiraceae bacterium]|nr:hypothetical protein [Lachnospiraceae bacterium]